MTKKELEEVKVTIYWLLQNGDFKDSETAYNISMNAIKTVEQVINKTESISDVSSSGYPIHIYKWGTEKETYCGIDLNTKGISFVVSSQVKAFINDDKSKICQKCASYHYR